MNTLFRKLFTAVALLLVLTLSRFITIPVYADEASPIEENTTTEQVEETNQPVETVEEATPPSTGGSESTSSEEYHLDEELPILEQLPENTEIIVLDEEGETIPLANSLASSVDRGIVSPSSSNTEIIVLDEEGETIPLATEEAKEVVSSSDPMWCPAGKTPIANVGGCSPDFTTFSDLLAWLQANDPGMAG